MCPPEEAAGAGAWAVLHLGEADLTPANQRDPSGPGVRSQVYYEELSVHLSQNFSRVYKN